jgi:serpin B
MTDPTIAAANIVRGNNEFALDLYSRLARAEKSNLFFSPYSISSALAMTFAGACGDTEQEMARVLRFPVEQEQLHTAFSNLNRQLLTESTLGYTINVANRLWGQQGFRINPRFLELLRARYGGELEQMDFVRQPELACQKINQWVEDQTAGKIRNLISPEALNEFTHLLLVNAVYFKGDWTEKFDEAGTKEAPFHLGILKKVKVRMMHQQADFSYAEVGDIQVLELPYGNRDLSMVVLLPSRVGVLAQLESSLSVANLNKWTSALVPQSVKVFLPRFRLTEQFALAEVLKSMGMASAFHIESANFFGITDPGACMVIPLCISEVIHKAFVEVNEVGTEAAAATAVTTALLSAAFHRPPPVPVFRADHPFVFLIRHNESGSILFMGRVTNPDE